MLVSLFSYSDPFKLIFMWSVRSLKLYHWLQCWLWQCSGLHAITNSPV